MDTTKFDNIQNVYYQAWSWHHASMICNTFYCIKIRSDCKFNNIDPLIEAIKNNPGKIISVSPFFRPCKYYYCPSDFVIGTLTNEACIVTQILLKSLQSEILSTTPAERKICFSILSYRNLVPSWDPITSKEQMKNNYYIVDVNKLQPTMYWQKMGPYYYFIPGHHDCISNIDDF
jgi:hypothetical protein